MISDQLQHDYDLLTAHAGYVKLPQRTLLRFSGHDAGKFLHNFCTADVTSSRDGETREAFVLDARGKTLAFGHIIRLGEELIFTAACSSTAVSLRSHFEKYIIREDVSVTDESMEFQSIFVCGPQAPAAAEGVFNLELGQAQRIECGEFVFVAAHSCFAGDGILLLVANADQGAICSLLSQLEIAECSQESLEMVRLESGTPWYGKELDGSNLPQELRRDDTAISFTKGCYLGQETVAKIDSIGHVNRLLVGIQIASDSTVTKRQDVFLDGQKVGVAFTPTYSPVLSSPIAFAYVKRQHAQPGTVLSVNNCAATIVSLPIKKAAT